MKHASWRPGCLLIACLCGLAGCAGEKKIETTANVPAQTPDEPLLKDSSLSKPEEPAPEAKPETPDTTTDSTPPSKPSDETPAVAAGEPLPTKVTLGDPTLTAGIPGEGPLTVEQVKAWLATPGVHEPLEVELPFGLSLAANKITGLKENPLTRAKIELGRQLYFDPRLCADATVSCASCHHPDQGYGAHTRFGVGINQQEGNRNSPVSYNRILSSVQFWDGRAASLEEQAKGPIANPIEMGNTHEAACATVGNIEGYKLQFDAVFGPDSVTIDNVAKAIASYERTIVTGPSPYDYYAALKAFLDQYPTQEDLDALKEEDEELYHKYLEVKAASDAHPISESAIRGMALFFSNKTNCTACHAGANFTDELYHNLGVGMDAEQPDLGRFAVTQQDKDRGAFKTPTVRNVALSAPYMHDGSQKTLQEVVEWYAKGGHPNPHLSDKIKKLELTDQDKADLVAFMEALTGDFPIVEHGRLPE